MLEGDVCLGNQMLRRTNPAVADAAGARARLARVAAGVSLAPGDVAVDGVKALQRALIVLGYSTAADGRAVVDGAYDAGTERGVRQFQIEAGLPPSGVLDAPTWAMLAVAVRARLATLDADDRARQRDVLDGALDLSARELCRRHGAVVAAAAAVVGIRDGVFAAIATVASDRGVDNRPRYDAATFAALTELRATLEARHPGALDDAAVVMLVEHVGRMRFPADADGAAAVARTILPAMAGGEEPASLRQALATARGWTLRRLRELASAWGWGHVAGWRTVRKPFAVAGVTLAGLQSLKPEVQLTTLARALAAEPGWREAAQEADARNDFAPFVARYDGLRPGTPAHAVRVARLAEAAGDYASG